MSQEPTDAWRIDDLVGGFRVSALLISACRLGVFRALADGPRRLEQLVERLELSERGLRILLDGLVGQGLLVYDQQTGYANSQLAQAELAAGTRDAEIAHLARQAARWAYLEHSVRSGTPVPDEWLHESLRQGPREFARAMADVARRSAGELAGRLQLDGARRMLDLGGGPGLYAIALAQRWPGLAVTVLDTDETLEETRRQVRAAGLEARVKLRAGDIFETELGGGWDAVLISNVLHIYGAEQSSRLVGRCAAELNPGGRLVVKDFFLGPQRGQPAWASLFAVNMLVATDSGESHRLDRLETWYRDCGLEPETRFEVGAHSQVVVGRKPV